MVDLPWGVMTDDRLDVQASMAQLDADHHGLDKVKDRIVEYLAVRQLRGNMKGPIMCLAGPPGVGKTSLGISIADSMNRKFNRISLGGVHDEAEIRGASPYVRGRYARSPADWVPQGGGDEPRHHARRD